MRERTTYLENRIVVRYISKDGRFSKPNHAAVPAGIMHMTLTPTPRASYGGVALCQRKRFLGCQMGHFVNRHHFFLEKAGSDANSQNGTSVKTPGDLGCTVSTIYLTSDKKESR